MIDKIKNWIKENLAIKNFIVISLRYNKEAGWILEFMTFDFTVLERPKALVAIEFERKKFFSIDILYRTFTFYNKNETV